MSTAPGTTPGTTPGAANSGPTTSAAPIIPRTAGDLMDRQPPTVVPETPVGQIARLLMERHLSGVPVVAPTGELIGLVTQADLVVRHAHVHFPFYLTLLGGAIPFGEHRFEEEIRRITGRTAADVMSEDPFTVDENTPVEDVATRMAEDGVDPVVVVHGDKLAGLITREQLVQLVAREAGDDTATSASGNGSAEAGSGA